MRDVEIPSERICDPVGKRFPSLGRDPARTPMQWDASRHAGFGSGADPWLPVGADADLVNVARQRRDPNSLLSFYRRLIRYRKGSVALTEGTYRPIDSPEDTFVYLREAPASRVLVALNFGSVARCIDVPFANRALALATVPAPHVQLTTQLELAPATGAVVEALT
jgi:alpha-glucosidase